MTGPSVAIVHDYLTQLGGAERVVLALAQAFPGAPIHTSLFDPAGTFPEFRGLDVRTLPVDRIPGLHSRARLAMPVLAPSFSRLEVEADVVICSSSGWAHGARVAGRKIVYCHTPARWLYQQDRYLDSAGKAWSGAARLALAGLRRPLLRWDAHAAGTADRYLVNSKEVRRRVAELYGIEAEIVHAPHQMRREDPRRPVPGVEPGFYLCVSRLLSYKNVDAVVAAFADLPGERLAVVGGGPEGSRLRTLAGPNVMFLGEVADDELRWLYGSAAGFITASHEDFGLTPLEANTFGVPVAALRWGGYLETVRVWETGVLFDAATPAAIAAAVRSIQASNWDHAVLTAHGDRYGPAAFTARLRAIVDEEAACRDPWP